MQKSIGAVLYHCSETIDPDARHIFCDKTDGTCCKYQKTKLEGKDYVDKPGIPIAIKEIISPIFMDLSKPEFLIKCLHGKTQNNNECLNGVIWKQLPKDIFVNRTTLEMGICSALISFNDGAIGFKTVLEKLFLLDGYFTNKYCLVADQGRIKASDRKSMPHVKKVCKRLHAKRKGYGDKDFENEGETYAYKVVKHFSLLYNGLFYVFYVSYTLVNVTSVFITFYNVSCPTFNFTLSGWYSLPSMPRNQYTVKILDYLFMVYQSIS